MEDLFPALPEDISAVSDEELKTLVSDHESAKDLIAEENTEFLKDLSAEEILAQLEKGGNQYQLLLGETELRERAHENYEAKKQENLKAFEAKAEDEGGDEGDPPSEPEPEPESDKKTETLEVVAEEEVEEAEEEKAEERELVLASADPEPEAAKSAMRFSRTPPAPKADRMPQPEVEKKGAALVAAGEFSTQFKDTLDRDTLAELVLTAATHYGPSSKTDPVGRYSKNTPYNGPHHKIAKVDFPFPDERSLTDNATENAEKLREVIVAGIPGGVGGYSLTASGGLCAPAEPFYSMVNFATTAEPVWDALPIFAARRGAVNVPESTYIADITTAITSISEENDALGGTYATKSCQALDCVDYTETAVNIIAHCREYGNLNARSWPEKIAHENELTMAALARTSEQFILDRIKALSVNVTNGVETLGALIYFVDGVVKSAFGIRGRFRMDPNARFRVLLPTYAIDLLILDTIQNQFDRYRTRGDITSYLASLGIDVSYYIDTPTTGDSQLPDASQAAGAIDGLPNTVQWAIFPEGAFLGLDMGVLELGIVRDSELNSTNDFQVFGERFRNVARIAPAQSAYWVTTDWCPVGTFPPAGTARTCE